MLKGVIDRFENRIAVVEVNGKNIEIPKNSLPEEAKEGDCLLIYPDKIVIDSNATKKAREEINSLLEDLF